MNVKLLRRIQKAIRKEPRRFNMLWWVVTGDQESPCGTSACIGGYAVILSKIPKLLTTKKWLDAVEDIRKDSSNTWDPAKAVLGLDTDQATRLFDENRWPREFSVAYQATEDRRERAKLAIKRIDFFIKTKGND